MPPVGADMGHELGDRLLHLVDAGGLHAVVRDGVDGHWLFCSAEEEMKESGGEGALFPPMRPGISLAWALSFGYINSPQVELQVATMSVIDFHPLCVKRRRLPPSAGSIPS